MGTTSQGWLANLFGRPNTFLWGLCWGMVLVGMSSVQAETNTRYITGGIGAFDIEDDTRALEVGGWVRFPQWRYRLSPLVGLTVNEDSGVYGFAGLGYEFTLSPRWQLLASFSGGLYEKGDGKDLGGIIEFRSGLDLQYVLENQHRVGLSLSHISNSKIYDLNPGAESLLLIYSVPF